MKNAKQVSEVKTNFMKIPKELAQSKNLNNDAKAIILYLLSLPKEFHLNREIIGKTLGVGRVNTKKAFDQLIQFGYVVCKTKKVKGKINYEYEINPCSEVIKKPLQTNVGAPMSTDRCRSTDVDAPTSVNGGTYIRDSLTKDYLTKDYLTQDYLTETESNFSVIECTLPQDTPDLGF